MTCSLYGNYEKYYRLWEKNTDARVRGITPPVFIVVCNNTNVSKLIFDFIAGWEKPSSSSLVVCWTICGFSVLMAISAAWVTAL